MLGRDCLELLNWANGSEQVHKTILLMHVDGIQWCFHTSLHCCEVKLHLDGLVWWMTAVEAVGRGVPKKRR